jgi:hypothetical protein
MAVSCERLSTEEAGRILMKAEQERILAINVCARPEETCREDEWLAINSEFTTRRRSR